MSLVVDSNVLMAQAVHLPYSVSARRRFQHWLVSGASLAAPMLWQYEAASALRRLISLKELTSEQANRALDRLYSLGVESVAPSLELQRSALDWSEKLGRSKAYDSAYLAVAEKLAAPFWTADQHLVRNARALGLDWVHDATTAETGAGDDGNAQDDRG